MFCIVISGKTNTFMQIWTHYKSITSGATPSFSVIIISWSNSVKFHCNYRGITSIFHMGFCTESSEDFLTHIYIFQILSITFIPGSEVYPNTSIMKKKELTTLVIIYPQHTSNHATTHIFYHSNEHKAWVRHFLSSNQTLLHNLTVFTSCSFRN